MKGNMTQKTEEKSKGSFKDRRKECIEKLDATSVKGTWILRVKII